MNALELTPREPVVMLSDVLLRTRSQGAYHGSDDVLRAMFNLDEEDLASIVQLANKHHVVIRALEPLCQLMSVAGNGAYVARLTQIISDERERIQRALSSLEMICEGLRSEGCELTLIKSLDHWPDLGNDLDLFADAEAAEVERIMRTRFGAQLEPRSLGDRMANKWNFAIPGLRELVEVHVGRLGQTGEHVHVARELLSRAGAESFGSFRFVVPAPEDRIILATLQRMYRHFYLRLCDIVNTTELVERRSIDYVALRSSASEAGIWEGVASYLCVVSDYVRSIRGEDLPLPAAVRSSARMGGDGIYFDRDFLRVPIVPQAVKLYVAQLSSFLQRGDLPGSLRLSMLPCLATAAALGQKLTGSDKGIW